VAIPTLWVRANNGWLSPHYRLEPTMGGYPTLWVRANNGWLSPHYGLEPTMGGYPHIMG